MTINSALVISMTDALTGKWFRADNIATISATQPPQRRKCNRIKGARGFALISKER